MLLTQEKIYFATSVAKGTGCRLDPLTVAKHLETLVGKEGGVPLEILKRTKDEEVNKKTFSDIINVMKSSGVCSPKLHT
jgi:nucleosome binding factor SPN SPT16 subunit